MNRTLPFLAALLLPAAAFAAGEGLDSLSDDALLSELGSRGMTTLLNRAFEVNKVPESARAGQLALIAISQLNDPAAKLAPAQKRALVDQAVKGIESALTSLNDPKSLMKATTVLIKESVEPDVNTLEYWGDNPKTQSQLRPVVQAIIKMLDKAHDSAADTANKLANQIKGPNDKTAIAQYEEFNNLSLTAEYTKNLLNYDLVLSIDKADHDTRNKIVEDTLKYLKDFDTADQPVRGLVDLRIGKLNMQIDKTADAIKAFALVAAADPKEFSTAPDISQQYEARYFTAVANILANKPDDAEKAADAVGAWQDANLPKNKNTADGAAAALAMLKYRIASLRVDQATGPAAKSAANDKAVAVLMGLLHDQPQYQNVIFEQLMGKLPKDAAMETLDPLLLQALVHKGEELAIKPDALDADGQSTVERAAKAAHELITRKGVAPQLSSSAALLQGFLLQKLDRKSEAANAYLDFAAQYGKDPAQKQNADLAVKNAEAIVGQLRSNPDSIDEPAAVKVYDRLLPIAINPPYSHNELAYEYAKRLLKQNKPVEAVKYFKLVPADDKRILFSHYYQTIALKGVLDTLKANDPQRASLLSQIQSLADEVRTGAQAAAGTASEKEKASYRSMLAGTSLLAAELARADQKQPQRALTLLADFESQAKGLSDENQRLTDMLLIRVQAYMSLNQAREATNELVKLLDRNPAEGGRLVYDVLTSLNDQLGRAEAAGNQAEIREISLNRAKLTGSLVELAKSSKDPNIQKLSYGYAVFDAEVQRYAAMQETSDAAKKAGLQKAYDLFKKLEGPEGVTQYQADMASRQAAMKKEGTAEPRQPGQPPEPPPAYDPAVVLGLARTSYDLGEWKDARDRFSKLVGEKKLGPPVRITHKDGQEIEQDNDQFWEANYKLLKANFTLNEPTEIEKSKRYLKTLYIREGANVGGKKWHDEFEKLRAEVISDFDPNTLTPPSSQPAAK